MANTGPQDPHPTVHITFCSDNSTHNGTLSVPDCRHPLFSFQFQVSAVGWEPQVQTFHFPPKQFVILPGLNYWMVAASDQMRQNAVWILTDKLAFGSSTDPQGTWFPGGTSAGVGVRLAVTPFSSSSPVKLTIN
eukprot:TRINITY_DN8787_c0_g1_i1.p1 TRINITY_DN8787_c0_g1~~TRINITY_DN8787_c0_g1_i1.p1  ORF type:complete len:134 (+),score=17.57 TRINITY_DN8787_c0_g1_i1:317-718(+)